MHLALMARQRDGATLTVILLCLQDSIDMDGPRSVLVY